MGTNNNWKLVVILCATILSTSGCILAAGAAGAEAGYVVAQKDRSAGETLDDQIVHTKVKSALVADKQVSGLSINVDVLKGNVILRGYLKSQEEIDRAVDISRKVEGVKSVESRMVVDSDI